MAAVTKNRNFLMAKYHPSTVKYAQSAESSISQKKPKIHVKLLISM
jgi:hypothetical protein